MKCRHARAAAPQCAERGKAGVQAGGASGACLLKKESVPRLDTVPQKEPFSARLPLAALTFSSSCSQTACPCNSGHFLLNSLNSAATVSSVWRDTRCQLKQRQRKKQKSPQTFIFTLRFFFPLLLCSRLKNLLLFKGTPLNYFLLIVTSLPLALYPGILTEK